MSLNFGKVKKISIFSGIDVESQIGQEILIKLETKRVEIHELIYTI